ncbi:MAG TPA: exonuclease domain-containing protein [Nitrolancea sp.]|nr:exonuclease domain-containing protein [Nitrolancea sp.]
MVAGQESGAAYTELRQRATLYVRESGGSVPEDILIAHVFGGGGNPALWRPLLRQILSGHEDIVLRSDGCWSDPSNSQLRNETFPTDFVVLDVETTGLKPYRQRIIEIGVIRFAGGVRTDIYSTLVNPERRLPAYISQLTGIDDTMLVDAPLFHQIADDLVSFIGDALIVGYNVGFDLGFVNAELKRVERMSLINESLDLLPLASQLLTGIRRPGLDGLCRGLDIAQRERHRAMVDAEATALVFGRLLDVARERGLDSVEDLQRAASVYVPTPRRRDSVGRGRAVLDRSHLDGIPSTPGVYLMMDVRERVIYVGKAKNLRNRVSSYYSQPLGYTRKMDGLLESIERIEIVQTGSELEALLLESQLILRHQPQFNRQQRNTESYRYIKIDISNPWPRVILARQRNPDDAVYFGPFRVGRAAKVAVELVNDTFKLRTCPRSFKNSRSYGSPCLQLSLGKCPGPCVGSADRDEYRRTIHEVIGFLRGERSEAIELIQTQLAEAAEHLDFERAARLRDRMRRVHQLILSQQILDDAAQRGNLVIVTPSVDSAARELLLVVRGRLWAQFSIDASDSVRDVVGRLGKAWQRTKEFPDPGVDHDSLDQVHILERWLRKHSGHPAILPLDDEPDWREVVAHARALTVDELTLEHVEESIDSDELDVASESFAPSDAVC